jgi:hypothetical protein
VMACGSSYTAESKRLWDGYLTHDHYLGR